MTLRQPDAVRSHAVSVPRVDFHVGAVTTMTCWASAMCVNASGIDGAASAGVNDDSASATHVTTALTAAHLSRHMQPTVRPQVGHIISGPLFQRFNSCCVDDTRDS